MGNRIRIGTRESQLAVWQATQVKDLLADRDIAAELVYLKSEGDIDLQTPLYELGVQGIFTRSLDIALLNNKIDVAVHSMKDVPTQLPTGLAQAAVLPRASYKDLLVFKEDVEKIKKDLGFVNNSWQDDAVSNPNFRIATSSIRRKAQWLNRYPTHQIDNLRGNVNTRMQKLHDSDWNGAIFAAAGLERINLRPENSIELDWMLPAPAQGAIMVMCRDDDATSFNACHPLNDPGTALCTKIERDFLRALMGGCSTPISALAVIKDSLVIFKGSILSIDGKEKAEIEWTEPISDSQDLGMNAAAAILKKGGAEIAARFRNAE